VSRNKRLADVRLGSKATFCGCTDDFRSTPENGHPLSQSACLKRATTGLMRRSKLDAGQPVKWVGRITLDSSAAIRS